MGQPGENWIVANRRHSRRRVRPARPGLFDTIIDGATDIMGSVAKELAPDVVEAVDIDAVLQSIDMDALLERIDLNKVVARVDLNTLLQQVDIEALVQRTPMGSLIAQSGAGLAGKVLDAARGQGVGLDTFVHRWTDRVLRRRPDAMRRGPPLLVRAAEPVPS
jgi:hypothetical protein